jgi:hypothetical protein
VSGDRIEVKFDYTGDPGYSVDVRWNGASVASGPDIASGRAEIAAYSGGARWSSMVWTNGAVAAHAGPAAANAGLLEFRGAGEVQLRGYTVVKYPALAH